MYVMCACCESAGTSQYQKARYKKVSLLLTKFTTSKCTTCVHVLWVVSFLVCLICVFTGQYRVPHLRSLKLEQDLVDQDEEVLALFR